MIRSIKIISSIPRTIWFNFRYLPFMQAIKLPVWIANNFRIKELHRGCLGINGNLKIGLIRLGYHEADGVDIYSNHTIINVARTGRIIFDGDAHIGQGAVFCVKDNAKLSLGRNFAISGTTSIICSKAITFGDDVQLSWDSLIMDSDAHKIYDEEGRWINPPCDITIGNKVWIAANTTIAKGSVIGDNTVVASNSLVNSQFTSKNNILAGCPAKIVKHIGHFNI